MLECECCVVHNCTTATLSLTMLMVRAGGKRQSRVGRRRRKTVKGRAGRRPRVRAPRGRTKRTGKTLAEKKLAQLEGLGRERSRMAAAARSRAIRDTFSRVRVSEEERAIGISPGRRSTGMLGTGVPVSRRGATMRLTGIDPVLVKPRRQSWVRQE